jgi:predicted RNA-binding Zn-ribbon protein involved in translation (DUF1610 family)
MNQLAQCSSCPTVYYVDVEQIARGLSRFACPVCGNLTDFTDKQRSDPNASQGTKDVWAIISAIGVVAGLVVFAHVADRVIDQMTA